MVKYHLAIFLAGLTIAGCSGFKEFEYRHSQMKRAQDAWKAAGPTGAGGDYKDGWKTGYYDLSMGSDGQVPPVPPKKYWTNKYQNPEGQQCISDWYAGYQDGVIAAEHVGEYEWQLVPSSGVAALPTATVIDYPTHYGSPHASENELPEPLSSEPLATSEHRQIQQTPQEPWNDTIAAAAQPVLDLRTLTGRPSVSTVASQPERQAYPAPPAPHRVFERVPQPVRHSPLATNAPENARPSGPRVQVDQPTPATIAEQNLASQLEGVETPRIEVAIAWPPSRMEEMQARSSNVTNLEPGRQARVLVDDELQSLTADVRDIAFLPKVIAREHLVTEWPATTVTSSPTSSLAPSSTAKPSPAVVSAQQLAIPPAELDVMEAKSGLAHRKSSGGDTPIVDVKPVESKPQRDQVVRQQPTPSIPSLSATTLVTPTAPITILQTDDQSNSVIRSMTARSGASIGSTESVVRLAEPFQLDSSDMPRKPIVLVARPLRLSETSTTQR